MSWGIAMKISAFVQKGRAALGSRAAYVSHAAIIAVIVTIMDRHPVVIRPDLNGGICQIHISNATRNVIT